MKIQSLFLFSFFLLFVSCHKGQMRHDSSESRLDSLADHCYTLMLQLHTDSLRMAATNYMDATVLHSERYFNARQYFINSYFNAKEYDKVLEMLAATEKMPHFADYPSVVCNYQYTRGRVYQFTQRYPQAIEAYKKCLAFDAQNSEEEKKLQNIILGPMTQLMNIYLFNGIPEEGYRYFRSLKEHPTQLIEKRRMRDLYAHLAYLAYQSGHQKESYVLADSIFVLPLHDSTPERLFRDYSYAAVVYYGNADAVEKTVRFLEQAMQEAEKYEYIGGVQWSMDLLASRYQLLGKIEEGTQLQYKALEIAKKRGDKGAESRIYANLALLYTRWELYAQGNEYANQAMEVVASTDKYQFMGYAFTIKAAVMRDIGRTDSAIFYYKKATELFAQGQIEEEEAVAKENLATLLIQNCTGDSLATGVRIMREQIAREGNRIGDSFSYYSLGKGLIKQGHIAAGEAMLDSMYLKVSRMKDVMYVNGVLEFILDHYVAQGNAEKVMQYAPLYRRHMTIRFDENISRKVTAAMIKYQTEKKEQQLKLATAELAVKDLKIKLYISTVVVLLLALMGGLIWYLHLRKLHAARQRLAEQEKQIALREREWTEVRMKEQEQQLQSALENLRDTNRQSEQMHRQFEEFLASVETRQSFASMSPAIFRQEGEVKFRRYFNQLYPSFLLTLKERIPEITRGEEVLCMLIVLGQNMDEVADILCIEKKSVKMSRYRLRKKMEIEQDDSLEKIITDLL